MMTILEGIDDRAEAVIVVSMLWFTAPVSVTSMLLIHVLNIEDSHGRQVVLEPGEAHILTGILLTWVAAFIAAYDTLVAGFAEIAGINVFFVEALWVPLEVTYHTIVAALAAVASMPTLVQSAVVGLAGAYMVINGVRGLA